MRAVVQRVTRASVRVDGEIVGAIDRGLSALIGIGADDERDDAEALARKIVGLRVFSDEEDKMNLSLPDVGGALLAVSQFTLFGDVRKGKRPSFAAARAPDEARPLFEAFVEAARGLGIRVETGRFRAHMEVELVSDGPVTLLLDTKRLF